MKKKGFTLIEVISAIVIIGIIAVITVPITVRVISEAKRRSFYATAEGIVKAAIASNLKNEEDYGEYFQENEMITFKFSKTEGKEGESVELVNGKKIKLSFEGKAPIGGEVHLYKNGNVEVVDLTDGTYYANKDADTELVVSDTSNTLTRGQLQIAVEELQKQNQEFLKKIESIEKKNESQDAKDKELEKNLTNIDVLAKTYPIGSIYISENSTNPGTIFGGTWESYGTGRTLVGINTNDTNFNTVSKTGGKNEVTLTTENLPSHNHTIPSLNGTTSKDGGGNHKIYINAGSSDAWWFEPAGAKANLSSYAWSGDSSEHLHTHTITTNASITGSTGSGASFSNLQPYITVYMWKRVA